MSGIPSSSSSSSASTCCARCLPPPSTPLLTRARLRVASFAQVSTSRSTPPPLMTTGGRTNSTKATTAGETNPPTSPSPLAHARLRPHSAWKGMRWSTELPDVRLGRLVVRWVLYCGVCGRQHGHIRPLAGEGREGGWVNAFPGTSRSYTATRYYYSYAILVLWLLLCGYFRC